MLKQELFKCIGVKNNKTSCRLMEYKRGTKYCNKHLKEQMKKNIDMDNAKLVKDVWELIIEQISL